MLRKLSLLLYTLIVCCFATATHSLGGTAWPVHSSLTAHEWGTFTSIAGADGRAVEWSPQTGSTDLPGFVEHLSTPRFKLGLRGTVRMETPVLYFYDSQEERVSVKVSFAKGLITEWYPHAGSVGPAPDLLKSNLFHGPGDGTICWDSVTVSPAARSEFPREARDDPYYSARMTSSTPLRVMAPAGEQREKFLFYRGVSAFTVPLSATLTTTGAVRVENLNDETIPNTILFERRGDKVGYRLGGPLRKESDLAPLELTGSVDDLARQMEGLLVSQGLYQDEAHAMLETWRASWFEEGSRLLYFVPAGFLNSVLPLSIQPAPAQTIRVFVGRLELVTPATEKAVESAFAARDEKTLKAYGRFLEPILATMIKKEANAERAGRLQTYLSTVVGRLLDENLGRN